MHKKFFFIFIFILNITFAYEIKFHGVDSKEILKKIKESAFLEKTPPKSIKALRIRVEKNIPDIIDILHFFGYYDCKIMYQLEKKLIANIYIELGTRYLLTTYEISIIGEKKPDISYKTIEIKIPSYITSKNLIDAKNRILKYLNQNGYILASIKKHDIKVDMSEKKIEVFVEIDKGPLCHFGSITITGLKNIYPRYIYKKISWKEGEIYSEKKISETEKRLLNTNLFTSVAITHSKNLDEENLLPIKIRVTEAKHKTLCLGVSYATVDEYGALFGWTHRNIRRMGEILNMQADISKKAYTGIASYKKPDFLKFDQDLIVQAYAIREKIRAYLAFTYGGDSKIYDKTFKKFNYSYGLRTEYINVIHSANNGKFYLVGFPFVLRYNNANHFLNPTKGYDIIYSITPFINTSHKKGGFTKQRISISLYYPNITERLVFAIRMQFGSIIGSDVYKIPMTKLFLGGSDDDLRGYRYKTVSPRNKNGEIIGGKSSIYITLEPRFRLSNTIGIVPFLDLGNIRLKEFPTFEGKWRKSYGIGLRYFTFFGPLRLDIAFPLDRYKKDDPKYRFYISIGQTF
ncbi:MAG: hypothetical protein AMS24_03845 [Chlamydiae bacterium SM23_39]|nr:MAG: hypothetical protein AMS24_03845 [Chlamydiae bacterium SM23_39]